VRIQLLTQVGTAGALCLVHEATIPPFQVFPTVITWGFRTFLLAAEQSRLSKDHIVIYEECFSYTLVP